MTTPPQHHSDPGDTEDVSTSARTDTQQPRRAIQLQLEGVGTVHPLLAAGHVDPRFILSDETCRIGRKYLAEMRRILTSTGERPAA